MLGYLLIAAVIIALMWLIVDILLSRPATDADRACAKLDEELDKK